MSANLALRCKQQQVQHLLKLDKKNNLTRLLVEVVGPGSGECFISYFCVIKEPISVEFLVEWEDDT